MMRKLGFVLFLSLAFFSALGQSFYAVRRERNLIATFGMGTSTYFGELSDPKHVMDAKPTFNVGLQYYLTNRIAIRSEVLWFTLSGDDAKYPNSDRVKRNLSFFSNNYEINAAAQINLLPNGDRYYRRPNINIYGFIGIGFLYFNPKTEYQGEIVALQPLQTENVSYSRTGLVIPYGLGLRYRVGPMLNISVEAGFRKTFTDYLDDVSVRNYPDPATLSSDLARALSKRGTVTVRGNPDKKDAYMLFNAKIEYYLPWEVNKRASGFVYSQKRKSNYRYNKKGGLRKKKR